jgi:WD40 repeat protein
MDEFRRSRAIVIGINTYSETGIPGLKSAVADATQLAALLKEQHGYDVCLLKDQDATLQKIYGTLAALASGPDGVTADDRLLVYFAGHGVAVDSLDGPSGYLVPYDALLDASEQPDRTSLLSMLILYDLIEKLPCRHLLLVLDCCFAAAFRWATTRDALLQALPLYQERYRRFVSEPSWRVLTSAGARQRAADVDRHAAAPLQADGRGEKDGQPHSPFALRLFEGLGGAADLKLDGTDGDGVVTIAELYAYLDATMDGQTVGLWPMNKDGDGEYLFRVPGKPMTLPATPPLDEASNPYRGLLPYAFNPSLSAEGYLFYGRQDSTAALCERVKGQAFTVVVGPSGSGKSSLVAAGLLPVLQREGWQILGPVRPGADPPAALDTLLAPGETVAQPFAQRLKGWSAGGTPRVLVVDQYEETITLCLIEAKRTDFQQKLAAALERGTRVVLTLRSDFEPQFKAAGGPLAAAWKPDQARFLVVGMSQDELRQVIVGPATARAVYFESATEDEDSSSVSPDGIEHANPIPKEDAPLHPAPEGAARSMPATEGTEPFSPSTEDGDRHTSTPLVDQLINEVMLMPGTLPLLSFTLSELYMKLLEHWHNQDRQGKDRALSAADYKALGYVVGALSNRAEAVYQGLDEAQQHTAQRVLLRMVALEGGRPTRRQVTQEEVTYADQAENARVTVVLDRFVAARLLVSGQDDAGVSYVEPAHDALVQGWSTLWAWIGAARGTLLLERAASEAARAWKAGGRQEGQLWADDPRLGLLVQGGVRWPTLLHRPVLAARAAVQGYRPELVDWLNALEKEFVQASYGRKLRNLRVGAGIGALLVALTVGVSITALAFFQQKNAAQSAQATAVRQAHVAASFGLSAQAPGVASTDYNLALLLDAQALKEDNTLQAREEWFQLLQQSLPYPVGVLTGHTDVVFSVAFSPDGSTLASGSADHTIVLSDLRTSRSTAVLTGNTDQVYRVTFSPDGHFLASGSLDGKVLLWDLRTHKAPTVLTCQLGTVWGVAFSPNGHTLAAGGADGSVLLWDVADPGQSPIPVPSPLPTQVWSVAFSPDGQTLAAGSFDGTVRLWNVTKPRHPIAGPTLDATNPDGTNPVYLTSVAFSPDSHTLAAGTCETGSVAQCVRGGVRLWNLRTPDQPPTVLAGRTDAVFGVAFSPDRHTVISASADGTVRLWNLQTKTSMPIPGSIGALRTVAISPDGRTIASGGWNGIVRLWDLRTVQFAPVFTIPRGPVYSVAFSPNRTTLASGSQDGAIRLWNLRTLSSPTMLTAHGGAPNSIAPSPDGRSIAFSPDGYTLAAAYADGTIRLWNLRTGIPTPLVIGKVTAVHSLAFSPDGNTLAMGIDNSAEGGGYENIWLWNLHTHGPPIVLQEGNGDPTFFISSVAFSPASHALAAGSNDGSVTLWNLSKIPPTSTVISKGTSVASVAFSPDGTTLAFGTGGGTIDLWDLRTQQITAVLIGHTAPVSSIAFSPDGNTLASGSADHTVRLWDLRTLQTIATLGVGASQVNSVAFSPDGNTLAAGSADGSIRLWDANLASVQRYACQIADRNLTQAEWNAYVGSAQPYQRTCPNLPPGT